MRKTAFTTVAIVAALVVSGISEKKVLGVERADVRKAPVFTLESFGGTDVSLSDYAGKIVVLEWFNDECPFVRYHYEKASTMVELANKYNDKGVTWLAVNSTGHATVQQNKDFAKKYRIGYPILDDRSGAVARAFGARSTPHMFVIDTAGNIAYEGAIDNSPLGRKKEGVVNYVDQALAELTGGKAVSVANTEPYGCSVKYKKALAFTLASFDGKQISLSDYEGQTVVLEWFNDECPFVRYHYEKAKTMAELAEKYENKGVVWLAVNSTSHATAEQNKDFAKKHQLGYPILDDRPGKTGRAYAAKSTPHMFVIDAKGGIVYEGAIDNSPLGRKKEGVVNYVDQALTELTGGKKVSIPATKPYGCSVKYAR